MDPATLGILSLVGTGLSAGMNAFGSIETGQANAAAANYQAAVAQNNAIINQQNAMRAVQAGRAQAQAQDYKNAARMGAIVAAEGASGIDVGSGSSKEVRDSAAQLGRLDTLNVMDTALNQSRAYQVAAMSDTAQAGLDTFKAQQASTAGMIGAAGSVISGASSFADKWVRFQDQGVFGGSGDMLATGGLY